MKIVLATYGSRGDVQPMLALSLAFLHKGHDVLLAAPPEKENWANKMGCPFYPLGSDLTAFIDTLKKVHSPINLARSVLFLRKELKTQFDVLPRIVSRADLVVGSSLIGALPSIAEARRIPYRYIAFTPQLLPSSWHPFPAFKYQHLPRWFNCMTWQIANYLDHFNNIKLINRYRKEMGLEPIYNAWRHILGKHVIVASDSAIAKVPDDVRTPQFTQTGYMHLKQPTHSSREFEKFLEKGPTPIYAGFGSMPKSDQMNCVAMIVEAARLAGQRIVINRFWDEASSVDHCKDVFFIGKYPHLKLFSHMSAIIHHGGAGTTASAAVCGVPQIIVPHLLDQYYWGNQIQRLQIGPKPIWRSKLKVSNLAKAVEKCVSISQIKDNARRVARMIQQIDSLKTTIAAIFNSL
jgi:UDP:flavonoid glycosyltransferase YjiC (YdhE family)